MGVPLHKSIYLGYKICKTNTSTYYFFQEKVMAYVPLYVCAGGEHLFVLFREQIYLKENATERTEESER
jgi:hypothetical protein